jgi:hypothetical protein
VSWRIVINSEGAWVDYGVIPMDPPTGWTEAWEGVVPGYQRQRYETEVEANEIARRFRALGFSAATELVSDDVAGDEVHADGSSR